MICLKKCSTLSSPSGLTLYAVLYCEIFCIWYTLCCIVSIEVLCHSVHCKKKKKKSRELHSRYCFLNSSNRCAFNLSPFACYHSILSSVLCSCFGVNVFYLFCLVQTQIVCQGALADWCLSVITIICPSIWILLNVISQHAGRVTSKSYFMLNLCLGVPMSSAVLNYLKELW